MPISLSFGKTEARKMLTVLDPEYADWQAEEKALKARAKVEQLDQDDQQRLLDLAEQMALAEAFAKETLRVAVEIIEAKAKYTVVGQVKQQDEEGRLVGDKIALGWYGTEGQATSDALKLAFSTQTNESHLTWVLPIFHGTPANYYAGRKSVKNAVAAADKSYLERELQRRVKWRADHPEEPTPDEWSVVIPWGTDRDSEECVGCNGMGRVPRDELERVGDLKAEREERRKRLAHLFKPNTTTCWTCDGMGRLPND